MDKIIFVLLSNKEILCVFVFFSYFPEENNIVGAH